MIQIIHRINTIEQLNKIPKKYGVEIDVRGFGSKLLLNHDPIDENKKYDNLEDYLDNYHHSFIIFNMKEAGYEQRVIDLATDKKIRNYFLLDVEFPYLYRATRKEKFRKIAVRYSEAEPIESVEAQIANNVPLVDWESRDNNPKPLLDWVWIDTNTKLPLNEDIVDRLKPFKTCLVCPSRWDRPSDIAKYIEKMNMLNFKPNAVMTSIEYSRLWEKF